MIDQSKMNANAKLPSETNFTQISFSVNSMHDWCVIKSLGKFFIYSIFESSFQKMNH